MERTGRQRRAINERDTGPPFTKTLGRGIRMALQLEEAWPIRLLFLVAIVLIAAWGITRTNEYQSNRRELLKRAKPVLLVSIPIWIVVLMMVFYGDRWLVELYKTWFRS